jgi:hypothetical protein
VFLSLIFLFLFVDNKELCVSFFNLFVGILYCLE